MRRTSGGRKPLDRVTRLLLIVGAVLWYSPLVIMSLDLVNRRIHPPPNDYGMNTNRVTRDVNFMIWEDAAILMGRGLGGICVGVGAVRLFLASSESGERLPSHMTVRFVPSLRDALAECEKSKGNPLTREEVMGVVNSTHAMPFSREVAAAIDKGRGYRDINPRNCWLEWQEVRMQKAD